MIEGRNSTFEIDKNFQTPLNVAAHMAAMIPVDAISIFEPTPGEGNLLSVLSKTQYKITAADDFFLFPKTERYDCILMNPPFSSKSAFMDNAPEGAEIKGMKVGYYILKQCMNMSDNLIALMPWYTISDSDVRMRYLKSFGIKSLTSLSRKTFQYARIQTVIIELEKGYNKDTTFKIFNY